MAGECWSHWSQHLCPQLQTKGTTHPGLLKGSAEEFHAVRGQKLPHFIYSEAAKPAILLPTFPFPMSLQRQLGRTEVILGLCEVLSSWGDATSPAPVVNRGGSEAKLVRVAG